MLACTATAFASDSVERSGDLLRIALPVTALALTYKRQDPDGRSAFYRSFAAMALTTWGLKETVDKERPDGSGNDAFPSGHTAVAFQSAAFLHRRYGWRDAAWAYGLATYVAWTRVESDLHDTADVLAGAAIGAAASYWLVPRSPGIALTPQVGPGMIGIAFNAVF
jgi:membrane-associated phospholipid phosphatase